MIHNSVLHFYQRSQVDMFCDIQNTDLFENYIGVIHFIYSHKFNLLEDLIWYDLNTFQCITLYDLP